MFWGCPQLVHKAAVALLHRNARRFRQRSLFGTAACGGPRGDQCRRLARPDQNEHSICLMDPHVVKLSPCLDERVRGGVPWRATRTPVSAEFASNFNLALNSNVPQDCTLKIGRGDHIDWAATRKTRLWTPVTGLQRRARNRRAYSEQQQKPRGGASQPKKQP